MLKGVIKPLGNNAAKTLATTTTAASITFTGMAGVLAMYFITVTGTIAVSVEISGGQAQASSSTSLTLAPGSSWPVAGPANATVSAVSSAASAISVCPCEGGY